MRNFTTVNDIGNLQDAVKEALEVKANRFAYKHLGENKTLLMIFFIIAHDNENVKGDFLFFKNTYSFCCVNLNP